jgi:hypothetical protein
VIQYIGHAVVELYFHSLVLALVTYLVPQIQARLLIQGYLGNVEPRFKRGSANKVDRLWKNLAAVETSRSKKQSVLVKLVQSPAEWMYLLVNSRFEVEGETPLRNKTASCA